MALAAAPVGDRVFRVAGCAQRRLWDTDVARHRSRILRAGLLPRGSPSTSPPGSRSPSEPVSCTVWFWVTGMRRLIGWYLSTLAGALMGDVLEGPDRTGDAAAAAAFWRSSAATTAVVSRSWWESRARSWSARLAPSVMPGLPSHHRGAGGGAGRMVQWLGADVGVGSVSDPDDVADREEAGVTMWTAILVASDHLRGPEDPSAHLIHCEVGGGASARSSWSPPPDQLHCSLRSSPYRRRCRSGRVVDARVPAVLVAAGLLLGRAPSCGGRRAALTVGAPSRLGLGGVGAGAGRVYGFARPASRSDRQVGGRLRGGFRLRPRRGHDRALVAANSGGCRSGSSSPSCFASAAGRRRLLTAGRWAALATGARQDDRDPRRSRRAAPCSSVVFVGYVWALAPVWILALSIVRRRGRGVARVRPAAPGLTRPRGA